MKKTKLLAFFNVLLVVFFVFTSITGYSVQAAGPASAACKSTPLTSYAIDQPTLWDPSVSCKLAGNMKNYYVGFYDNDFGISAGYGGNVFYTGDSGATWTKAKNNSLCIYGLDIVTYDLAWACGNGGNVRVTKDGGKSWKTVSNFGDSEPNQCRFISFIDESNGWVASPKRLASTYDGGKRWTELKLPKELNKIAAVKLLTKRNGYLLSTNGYLFITANGGKSWTSHNLGLKKLNVKNGSITEQNSPSAIVYFFNEKYGAVIFHATSDKGSTLYDMRTYDGGKTWKTYVMPCKFQAPSVFLSDNGTTLTLSERNKGDLKQRDNVNIYYNQLPAALD